MTSQSSDNWNKTKTRLLKIDRKIEDLKEKKRKAELKHQARLLKLLKKYKILEKDITEIESILKNVSKHSTNQTE